jgi:hypothetical protein
MAGTICLELSGDEEAGIAPSLDSVALQASPESLRTLRLSIETSDPAGLEALRHARRSMLREEWTLGREPGEASLETAVFSPSEILWTAPASERSRCLEKLKELEARANRALTEIASRRK